MIHQHVSPQQNVSPYQPVKSRVNFYKKKKTCCIVHQYFEKCLIYLKVRKKFTIKIDKFSRIIKKQFSSLPVDIYQLADSLNDVVKSSGRTE